MKEKIKTVVIVILSIAVIVLAVLLFGALGRAKQGQPPAPDQAGFSAPPAQ